MAIKRSGNKPQNPVKAVAKNLRDEAFLTVAKNKNARQYDGTFSIPDEFSSQNGVVKTTAGNR